MRNKKILSWVFFGFGAIYTLIFFPSFASLIFAMFTIGIMPIKPIQDIWKKYIHSKIVKNIALFIVFIIACGFSPQVETTTTQDNIVYDTEVTIVASDTENVVDTEAIDTEEVVIVEVTETVESTQQEINENTTEVVGEVETSNPYELFDVSTIADYNGSAYVVINNNNPYFTDSELVTTSYEAYSELDALGRCGVTVACVGQDIMPTEERGEIGNVKPTGWVQNKYAGIVDGNYLYNRCHLIGYQLTGENANTRNLITGTRYLNIEGMLPFENMVADYVTETGNHVMYRATPIFEGDNLLASGVLMEGKSVEDKGEDILFCIYAYNVQPGISINYVDGSNEAIVETVAEPEAETVSSTNTQKEESSSNSNEGTSSSSSEGMCWKSATGSKYHSINDCGNMNPNKATYITIEQAKAQGLGRCSKCW